MRIHLEIPSFTNFLSSFKHFSSTNLWLINYHYFELPENDESIYSQSRSVRFNVLATYCLSVAISPLCFLYFSASPHITLFKIKDGLHSPVLFKFIMSDLFKCNECIINFHYKFRILPLFLPLQASFSFPQLSCFILCSLRNFYLLSSFQISLYIQFHSLVHTHCRNLPTT